MATFGGTEKEYNDFIGPRVRNVIQSMTRKEKNACNKTCQKCQETNVELDSAHKDKDRKSIIKQVLDKYKEGDYYSIDDIQQAENEIKEAHLPIKDTFLFLCKSCHKEYDDSIKTKKKKQQTVSYKRRKLQNCNYDKNDKEKEIEKVEKKIPGWFFKKTQKSSIILINFMNLLNYNDYVNLNELRDKCLVTKQFPNRKFKNHLDQMSRIYPHNHAKIFDINDDKISLWKPVEKFIKEEWGKHQ